MTITTILKNIIIYLRAWIKLIVMLLIGLAIIGFIVFVIYKPMYSVTLNGEFIGYTEDRGKLQKKITSYMQSGDKQNIAFVELDDKPEYKLCLLQKGIQANDSEVFEKIISSGVSYYKYYAIIEDGEEKFYVSSFDEAAAIIEDLKAKNSQNKDSVTYTVKYETELKEFTDKDTTVAALYKEMPVAKTKKKVVTTKDIDTSTSALGIALIKPINGTITSRFGNRRGSTHTGLDIATSLGTPIKAASSGTVTYAGWKESYGYLVVVQHSDSVQTYYAHCSKIYVSDGQQVSQGETIAAVGSTGNSTGPHLHLEIRVNGKAKNPQAYLY